MSYFFLLGLICPILVWLAARKWPKSFWRYISTPIIFGGTGNIPPANVMIYGSWAFVGTMFNKVSFHTLLTSKTRKLTSDQQVIKGRHPGWWTEYNYITSAALDSGTIICILMIFFALQLPDKVSPPEWWGGFGGGFMNNIDWNGTPKIVLTNGTFGPTSWK